uniref:Uncharacterized protein n=1 Tax=viral metagenome TaxID=1070528 RepID=A0A6M3LSS8_9ZZZZ
MISLLTKVRGYGWYCPNCEAHKDVDKIGVVKVVKDRFMTVICTDCNTEVVDCFLVDHPSRLQGYKYCDKCLDRFRCLTRADVVIEKELQSVKGHEIHSVPNVVDTRHIDGVRSYTGIYNHKLEQNEELYCTYPERDDCNHSWMRQNYRGSPYRRCTYMKYDKDNKEWFCYYGRSKRGEV